MSENGANLEKKYRTQLFYPFLADILAFLNIFIRYYHSADSIFAATRYC